MIDSKCSGSEDSSRVECPSYVAKDGFAFTLLKECGHVAQTSSGHDRIAICTCPLEIGS